LAKFKTRQKIYLLRDAGWQTPAAIPRCTARCLDDSQLVNTRSPPLFKWAGKRLNGTTTMSPLSLLLNLLWMIFGGIWMAIGWLIAAVIMAITIVGIPWARAAFNIASYTLLPFGRRAVSRAEYLGTSDVGTCPLGFLGNLIWLVLAGWWLALGHLITAIGLAITLIGIPFAWAHLKLAGIALWPIGKMIVDADDVRLRYQRP
jgi:uncharacterized membrane protein YccF (DUF307 family)